MKVTNKTPEAKASEEEQVNDQETKKEVVTSISPAMISKWKAEWGKLFKTTIDGQEYIWRKLRRKEYVDIMSDSSNTSDIPESARLYIRQEKITNSVVLYPANIKDLCETDAGLASTISDEVILKSGFGLQTTEEI